MVAVLMLLLMDSALSKVSAQSQAYPMAATVISQDGLNVRNGPSMSSAVIQMIPFATALSVTGASTGDGWYPIALGSLTGWALGDYIAAGVLDPTTASTARPLSGTSARLGATAASTSATSTGAANAANSSTASGAPPPPPSVTNLGSGSPPPPPSLAVAAVAGAAGVLVPPVSELSYQATASYYGVDDGAVTGKTMACGAPFDPYNVHAAATNDWPCGTKLRITAADGRNIDVVVADRGQYPSRWIDLTYAAFGLIADHRSGVVQVSVQVMP